MTPLAVNGRQGTPVDIDLCTGCRGFWFDRYESLRLSQGATLKLFTLMAEPGAAGGPQAKPMRCPRCRAQLALTHDMQHSTRFQYWQCPKEHGRFITFLDFLREKEFIRPLTAQQIAELRQSVQTVNCSNCGGPIDLAKESICPHCGSALSMLDMKQMAQMVAHLKEAGQPGGVNARVDPGIDPAVATALQRVKVDTEHHFAALTAMTPGGGSPSLIEAGLRLVANWLGNS
jgi:Zn-finger nucleic acid-binding protein